MTLHHHLQPFLLGDLDGLSPVAHQGERPRARALPQPLEPARGRRHAPRRTAARAKARFLRASRRRPGRFYVGRVERAQPEVFVVDEAVRRLDHPGPLGWGRAGAASRRLAAGLLRDATGRRPSPDLVGHFADEVIAKLHSEGFVLAAESIQRWARVA